MRFCFLLPLLLALTDASCPIGCICYQNVCQTCEPNYYNSILTASIPTCLSCITNCNSCSNNESCTQCNGGYFQNQNQCISCGVSNCLTCQKAGNCTTCLPQYYVVSNSNQQICQACSSNCLECSSTQCYGCTSRYFVKGLNCVACSANCFYCNSTACIGCNSQFYLNTQSTCSSCQQNCLNCLNSQSCSLCASSFIVNSSGQCIFDQNSSNEGENSSDSELDTILIIFIVVVSLASVAIMIVVGCHFYKKRKGFSNQPTQNEMAGLILKT